MNVTIGHVQSFDGVLEHSLTGLGEKFTCSKSRAFDRPFDRTAMSCSSRTGSSNAAMRFSLMLLLVRILLKCARIGSDRLSSLNRVSCLYAEFHAGKAASRSAAFFVG
jgi:hypothetical protein